MTLLAIIDSFGHNYCLCWPLLTLLTRILVPVSRYQKDRKQKKTAKINVSVEHGITDESRVSATGAETTRSRCRVWQRLPVWNGTSSCTRFRAIPDFACFFCSFPVSGAEITLCLQIEKLPFVFRTIKTRILYGFWKVVAVSGPANCVVLTQCSRAGL